MATAVPKRRAEAGGLRGEEEEAAQVTPLRVYTYTCNRDTEEEQTGEQLTHMQRNEHSMTAGRAEKEKEEKAAANKRGMQAARTFPVSDPSHGTPIAILSADVAAIATDVPKREAAGLAGPTCENSSLTLHALPVRRYIKTSPRLKL